MTIIDKLNERTRNISNEYSDITLAVIKELAQELNMTEEDLIMWRARVELKKYSVVDRVRREIAPKVSEANKELEKEINEASVDVENENARFFSTPDYELALKSVESVKELAFKDFHENVQKTLLDNNIYNNAIRKTYDDILQRTSRELVNGNVTLEQAIEKAVMDVYERGLPSEFIDKAGRVWNVERYAETVARNAMQNTYNKVRTARMEKEELYTVLVSSHIRAREACSYCQGKVIDIRPIGENTSGYPSAYEYGYGTPAGHRGINCRHQWFPFDPDINENNQPQIEPEDAQRTEAIYQQRNALARRIRKTKGKLELAKTLKSDSVEHYTKLLRKQQARMRDYVKEHDLKRDYSLERAPIQK